MTLLASRFEPQLRSVAQPLLRSLARATRATSFLSVAQAEECVVIMVEEPSEGMLRVGYRVGSRHPLTQGAAGIAILSGRLPNQDDDEVVRKARDDGYSLTCGQLQRGAVGVASPLIAARLGNGVEACIGVVALEDMDTERAICEVKASAKQLAKLIGQ
ncbi:MULTISPECIES: IclR family transcriptional regulator domain-containing protein [unclassified Halomonas]|uniref:IclR family transcriptional regulator domain-containing protein n=1 Tax=unclassified Halomonas TaxID=2609666 RepID=UPI0040337E15